MGWILPTFFTCELCLSLQNFPFLFLYSIFCLLFPAIPWIYVTSLMSKMLQSSMGSFMSAPLNQMGLCPVTSFYLHVDVILPKIFGVFVNPDSLIVSCKVLWVWAKINCVKYISHNGFGVRSIGGKLSVTNTWEILSPNRKITALKAKAKVVWRWSKDVLFTS